MGWDISVDRVRCRYCGARENISYIPYHFNMHQILFNHSDVYDYDRSGSLMSGEHFKLNVPFVPNWSRMLERIDDYLEERESLGKTEGLIDWWNLRRGVVAALGWAADADNKVHMVING